MYNPRIRPELPQTNHQAFIELNNDLRMPASEKSDELDWTLTPHRGVQRKLIERIGGERATHATSIVRYQQGAKFSAHTHDGGEEFLVLSGTFSDESGDYPKGWYVRNPAGSSHEPYSKEGCDLFVKLGQIPRMDRKPVRMDTSCANADWKTSESGGKMLTLHDSLYENVSLVRWPAKLRPEPVLFTGGMELYLIKGRFVDEFGDHRAGSWIRIPPGHDHSPRAIENCLLYVKTGHLRPPVR